MLQFAGPAFFWAPGRVEVRPVEGLFAPRMSLQDQFYATQHALLPMGAFNSRGHRSLQVREAADIVAEVHHADLEARACNPDRAHDLAAHRCLLMAEYVFDAGALSSAPH